MTQEEKAKFFAQYWKQNVGRTQDDDGIIECLVNELSLWHLAYLLLTPLSMITDEDAIEVAKFFLLKEDHDPKGWIDKEKSLVRIGKFYTEVDSYNSNQADYLRSKGYALDWNGHTVEEMVEQGIIKLRTDVVE